ADGHCPHAAAIFLTYHIHLLHEKNFDSISDDMTHPPIPLESTFAVGAYDYGTIVNGPHQLERSPSNAAYSSLQYLLHNKKIINFPIPEQWKGKLFIQITSVEHFKEGAGESENLPLLRFKYKREDGSLVREISIFENLYLFNWKSGECIHLPPELKDLVQKLRLQMSHLDVNDLIKVTQGVSEQYIEVSIDDIPLKEIQAFDASARIHLTKAKKGSQIDINLLFIDNEENVIHAPDFLRSFTFNGGKLSTFRTKRDAYDFVSKLSESFQMQNDVFKAALHTSNAKNYWNNLIDYTVDQEDTLIYSGKSKTLSRYSNDFLKDFYLTLFSCFGDMFFRFSKYDVETRELTYSLPASTLFQGLSEFHTRTAIHGVQIYYNRNEISRWSSKIRFERKTASTNWFDLELEVNNQDLEIIENVDLDNGLALTKDGLVLLSKDQKDLLKFVKKYTKYESQNKYQTKGGEEGGEEDVNKFVLPFNRARIFELFELRKLGLDGALTSEEIELCNSLATLEKMPEYALPPEMDGVLRPYQVNGYNWLRFLHENKLGACLADDMGLGKTLQTIAFLASIYDQIDHVLIVCPVTILLNWEAEFKKFSSINVQIYHGGERKMDDSSKITLTSYGVMKREIDETFAEKNFDIVILDEVQHLKNVRSLGAYAARKLNSAFRICLTGTPVENDLAEFYNILDLSIPGIWGDLQFIRTSSTKKTRLLARKTAAPFILRRTKGQVLTDLPPKIENNVVLNFGKHEDEDYKNSLVRIKGKIQNAPSKKKYGEILRGLLELRQKCLWQKRTGEMAFREAQVDSTKIEFLMDTLSQILEEGHQAIVFSQFTTYLDIIQKIVVERHWKHARIDGTQTVKKRQSQVELFQSGKAPVFLISLKAGGVGLNLTAASYVFIMDPWWNPAVESQAIDRAHRIGQKNTLTVYRPIIKGSVEEKVLELQAMKKELFRDLLPDDDDTMFTGKLTMLDFESLLT
ncbi:MAG: DEAD/DEAH box helicase, partial [Halobacteriovoraceae bacterium]|nr:DEAD/DEAH box helicase [Halobacteriovoraceae bacterium]